MCIKLLPLVGKPSSQTGCQVMQEPPCADHLYVFTLGDFLHHVSRRQAISFVLFHGGAYGHDFRAARGLEEELFTFCNGPVESALDGGRGIEITVGIHFYRHWIGLEPSFVVGGVPASSDAVKELAVVKYERGGDVREESCRICLEAFDEGVEVTQMPCMHAFHGGCLTRWLESSHICPLCRHAIADSAGRFRSTSLHRSVFVPRFTDNLSQ
ncbi:hypothetical protein OPV22_016621 [Ensete ventricosum]|uniref:RING-type domain-containing protein n=1 Tax=Ensete ventricosum TaxID=4639 RepID=A0AAV8QXU0_ENSVE|nr:hypothetical protein OPV22_016601 [Ensete ventricosum]KAJ8484125.1 hypothetical protein OPV22_016610 [Ensete ventricosum]KAJ8484130.1 hypothetical protein OPV22_016615 [Ensete ventricosum]KAJ8484136.1 hypothetical protein OPV22_016621 [Ensete ventricosum]